MVGILRVIKGEYALSNYITEVIISNFKADGAVVGGIAGTLDSYYFLGQGSRGNIEREFVVVIKDDIPEEDRTIDGKQPSR